MGSTGGGVWKTVDGGNIWENISDSFFRRASVGAISVCDADPNVIYVGMGESTIRSDVSHGDGVYKSTDGGRSWTHLGLDATRNIGKVRVDPRNPDVVYVAALGHAHGPNPERGIYRSMDGGATWEHVLFQSNEAGAVDLTLDHSNPRIMYAAFWEGVHRDYELSSGGPGSGIFRSTDGGSTWTELSEKRGLPEGIFGRIGITASPARAGRVWAIVEAQEGGVFRSDDFGDTWERVHSDKEIRQRPWYYMHIFAHPTDPETVWVLNLDCWRSTDGGRTFDQVPGTHGDYHDLWIDPRHPERIIQGNDGGATVSFNGGASWSSTFNQPTCEFYHVTTDSQVPYRIYGAQQDNTTISVPSRTHLPAITWGEAYEVGGGESGYIQVDPRDHNIVYAGTYAGIITRYDHRTGQRRTIMAWPEEIAGWAERDVKYRFQWTFPILISPHDPETLYITSQFVHRSRDEGDSWEVISPDLTRNDPERMGPSGGPITLDNNSMDYYCTIFAFAESPVEQGVLWAGSDDGLIHVSRDGGGTWQNVTPPDLPKWSRVSIIEASPHEAGVAYVAVDRHREDDFAPYLYRTADFGDSWTKIISGIPGDDFTRVIREDPNRRGLLYAGTETGVYVSLDDGGNWEPLQLNLPVVPVHDLVIKEKDLVAGTHGRGFWVLDDLSPLHELGPEVSRKSAHLYSPRDSIRFWTHPRGLGKAVPGKLQYHMWGITARTEIDENGETKVEWLDAGDNPPTGVTVYYHLGSEPDELTLTFLDMEGNEIRRFSTLETAEGEEESEPRPSANQGLNRFIWNMRYPDAYSFKGAIYRRSEGITGPLVPPGTYQVRLDTGGDPLTQSFTIRMDPRVDATQQDMEQQTALLLQIRDRISAGNRAIVGIRELREGLNFWRERARNRDDASEVIEAADTLDEQLTRIEEELVQTSWTSSRDALTAPTKLVAKLSSLAVNVRDGGDARPTRQSYEVFDQLATAVDEQVEALNRIVSTELPRFNELCRDSSLPALALTEVPSGSNTE